MPIYTVVDLLRFSLCHIFIILLTVHALSDYLNSTDNHLVKIIMNNRHLQFRRYKIIGNNFFAPQNRLKYPDFFNVSTAPTNRSIRIMIFTTWIHDNPLNESALNQKIYADHFGYDYVHVNLSPLVYHELVNKNANSPPGWSTVQVAEALLHLFPSVDYFVKLDVDCLFARLDLPIETILDPYEQYDMYTSQIEHSRFTQSHTWIIKNTLFAKDFLARWLEFRTRSNCRDLAQEQGAFHMMIGLTMKERYGSNVTSFTCHQACHTKRTTYHHHHCVLDWYTDNKFSIQYNFSHPNIFLYPYNSDHFISPDDGYTKQIDIKTPLNLSLYLPLTVHPCKKMPYLHPTEVLSNLIKC